MNDPSATRRKPDVSEEAIDYLKLADEDYSRLGDKYPSAKPAGKPKLNKMCADIALDYYNNKNDTKFEFIDETYNSCSVGDPFGIWIDCCFNAKDDSSIKHFSAEIQYLHLSGLELSRFRALEGETAVGCANCAHASSAMEIVDNIKDLKMCKTILEQEVAPEFPDFTEPKFGLKTLANPAAQLKFDKLCADIALDYYNNKNDTRFEFAEAKLLDNHSFSGLCGITIFCCFLAKNDSSINHFCATINYDHQSGLDVYVCLKLEDASDVPDASLILSYCNHYSSEEARKALEKVPKRPKTEIISLPSDGSVSCDWSDGSESGNGSTWTPASPAYKQFSPSYSPAICR